MRPTTGFPYLDQPRGFLALAHRGGSLHPGLEGLENTVAAFDNAYAQGYTHLETDVQATCDHVLVAFHNAELDRLTDRVGAIASLPYAEVATARIAGVHPVPMMATLLERFPEARFNIDIKAPTAIAPLAELILRMGVEHRVLVGSFSERSIRAFRRRVGPRVATSCGTAAVVATRYAPPLGRMLRDRGAALQVPPSYKGVRLITHSFIRRAHAAGRHVHAWTINDADQMRELIDVGVDGIFTDRTDVLREVLTERGLWHRRDSSS